MTEKIEITIHGAHQAALRFISVNVLDGAIKVSMMRVPWESRAGSVGVGETGKTGAAAMNASLLKYPTHASEWCSGRVQPKKIRGNSSPRRAARQATQTIAGTARDLRCPHGERNPGRHCRSVGRASAGSRLW